jgi:hypothetical protein
VEHLTVLQDVLPVIDQELSGHQNQDGRGRGGSWLGVEGEDFVLDTGKWETLLCAMGRSVSEMESRMVCGDAVGE